MAERYGDRVHFLAVYIREAHPEDGWIIPENRRSGIAVEDPKTDDERRSVAAACGVSLRMRMPMAIDHVDNAVASAYGGWPDRLYLIRQDKNLVLHTVAYEMLEQTLVERGTLESPENKEVICPVKATKGGTLNLSGLKNIPEGQINVLADGAGSVIDVSSLTSFVYPHGFVGSADEALAGADVFIGLSGPGAVSRDGIASMADGAVVFAMANPTPEIPPEEIEGLAAVVATGRSDYPNQINNVLAFPGIFRGALDVRATEITEEMKLAAAHAIAAVVAPEELGPEYIVPSVFNRDVVPAVASAVAEAAERGGVARRRREPVVAD